jgi:excisionase family DNA binding protein
MEGVTAPTTTRRLLTIDEAAERMSVSRDWLYRTKDLPFRRKISPKAVRFDEAGIDRWLAARAK